jgi:hypothetical protein
MARSHVDCIDRWLVQPELGPTGGLDMAHGGLIQAKAGMTSVQNSSSERFCSARPSPRLA